MAEGRLARTFFKPRVCILIGLFVNIVLTVFKFFAGIMGLSKAMVADALHSLSDIMSTVVVYIGICIAERPADEDHPYGHGNAETIAAVLVSIIIFSIGVYAGISALGSFIAGHFVKPLSIALFAAGLSIAVKELLFRYTVKVGRISNNPAIIADAWHHRSDAYSSVAAFVGIAGAKLSFLYLDSLAGMVVSFFIIWISVRLIRENIGIMMDEKPHAVFIESLKDVVRKTRGVMNLDSIKVHRRGSQFTVDLEISVKGTISVKEGHKIAANVRENLFKKRSNIYEVMVHVNPASVQE